MLFSASVAIFAIGGMFGGLLVGLLADKLGRKRSLHLNNVLSVVAGLLMFGAPTFDFYPAFHIGRFIMGVNAGKKVHSFNDKIIFQDSPLDWFLCFSPSCLQYA
jgi:predicted MFS family arabinose efflux permease